MEDPRLAFIYNEALRALQVQLAHFESLHARGATLIFAASFASSLLGGQAMANGLGAWDWLALGLLVGIGSLAVVILWPYFNWPSFLSCWRSSPGCSQSLAGER
jgi:hypothetical protein